VRCFGEFFVIFWLFIRFESSGVSALIVLDYNSIAAEDCCSPFKKL
jgi:hypothetical protein